jgi:hypothetical protein
MKGETKTIKVSGSSLVKELWGVYVTHISALGHWFMGNRRMLKANGHRLWQR